MFSALESHKNAILITIHKPSEYPTQRPKLIAQKYCDGRDFYSLLLALKMRKQMTGKKAVRHGEKWHKICVSDDL